MRSKRVIIHNDKYSDEIDFLVEDITEEVRQSILDVVHAKGWQDEDCWSEVNE